MRAAAWTNCHVVFDLLVVVLCAVALARGVRTMTDLKRPFNGDIIRDIARAPFCLGPAATTFDGRTIRIYEVMR